MNVKQTGYTTNIYVNIGVYHYTITLNFTGIFGG